MSKTNRTEADELVHLRNGKRRTRHMQMLNKKYNFKKCINEEKHGETCRNGQNAANIAY